jgi:hypothetical protein
MPYQLESSSDLKTYVKLGPVYSGGGSYMSITHSIAGTTKGFFRLRSMVPGSTSAVFNPATGVLTVNGNDQDNAIVVSRDAAGNLLVNGGDVLITGGDPTVANTTLNPESSARRGTTIFRWMKRTARSPGPTSSVTMATTR